MADADVSAAVSIRRAGPAQAPGKTECIVIVRTVPGGIGQFIKTVGVEKSGGVFLIPNGHVGAAL